MRCDYGQGFLLCQALDPEGVDRLLATAGKAPAGLPS
jgi:EAL domain-containing protein (putative c-di-GMP-specific phosphodiesterase class I)